MPLVAATGNIVDDGADCLVNTVNTVSVMGKGVALAFKQRFPSLAAPYGAACRAGTLRPGGVLFVEAGGRLIANLATKEHWRNPSRYEWVEQGLAALVAGLLERGASSVALPPPGCGNGGLDWRRVEPMVRAAFAGAPGIEVRVYAPLAAAPGVPAVPGGTRWRRGFPARTA